LKQEVTPRDGPAYVDDRLVSQASPFRTRTRISKRSCSNHQQHHHQHHILRTKSIGWQKQPGFLAIRAVRRLLANYLTAARIADQADTACQSSTNMCRYLTIPGQVLRPAAQRPSRHSRNKVISHSLSPGSRRECKRHWPILLPILGRLGRVRVQRNLPACTCQEIHVTPCPCPPPISHVACPCIRARNGHRHRQRDRQ
jgi:hypothetical protein